MNFFKRVSIYLILGLFVSLPQAYAIDELFTAEEVATSLTLPEVDQQPKPISQEKPDLKGELEKMNGFAKVAFIIAADGSVKGPRIQSSSDHRFDEPTLAAIGQWRFEPAKKDGAAVAVRVILPFRYTGK